MSEYKKKPKSVKKADSTQESSTTKTGVSAYRITSPRRFSKLQLLVFAVVFALVGGLVIWKTFAATCSGPINITAGGTYSGCWESNDLSPAVTISTTQPVIINNSTIRNLSGGVLVSGAATVDLTLNNNFVYGGDTYQTSGRFVDLSNFKNLVVTNNSIENTTGIEADYGVASSTIKVLRNRHHNIKGYADSNNVVAKVGNFVQFRVVQNSSIEVGWNEIVNDYNLSQPEDIISIYHTANTNVHDNMLWGESVMGNGWQSSQNGVTIDCSDRTGDPCSNNKIINNQVIDGYGIAIYVNQGGDNNLVQGNHIIADAYIPNGQQKSSGWSGLAVIQGGSNNHAHDNVVGYMNRDNTRCDWCGGTTNEGLNGAPEGGDTEAAKNTHLANPVNSSTEQNEWNLWQQKLTTNNVAVGASSSGSPTPSSVTPPTSPPPVSPPLADGWTYCTAENSHCSFTGTVSVRYGGGSTFYTKTSTDGVDCNNTVFGDPAPGADKHCDYQNVVNPPSSPSPTPTPTPPTPPITPTPPPPVVPSPTAGWTYCAAENSHCSFSGTMIVRYGADATFYTKNLTNGTDCTNAIFGDPLPGSDKHCDYQTPPPVTPPPVITLDRTKPSTPTNFRVTSATKTSVSLAWNASTDNVKVAGYTLNRSLQQIYDGPKVSVTNYDLSPGSSYVYYINAYDSAGNLSSPSKRVCVAKYNWWSKVTKSRGWGYC